MGFMFNGIPGAEVEISGDVTVTDTAIVKPSSVSTVVTTSGNITLGTVPANKKWIIYGWTLSVQASVFATLTMGGIVFDAVYGGNTSGSGVSSKVLTKPFILTAGETIIRNFNAGASGSAVVFYKEENA